MIHILKQVQFLPIDIKTAWDFFCRPENLNEITPPEVGFKVLSELPAEVYPGMMINYIVSPYKGVKLNWLTEITQVSKPFFFVDEQRKGPYSLWHHEHHFRQIEGGVEMTDIVHYQLPLGALGNLFHGLLVAPKLKAIFDYRKKVLNERFGMLLM